MTNYYIRYAGDFIYGKQNFFNGAFGIIPDELDGYYSSIDIPSLSIDDNIVYPDYFLYYISREVFYRNTEKHASGTGSKRIHEDTLLGFELNLPSIQEQRKIGVFFKELSDTITLHQQKLEKLKQLKKAYLQQMFI